MIRRGFGRGKIILFGEHCCVYGYPALVVPLDLSLELEWRRYSDGKGWDNRNSQEEKGIVEDRKEEWIELGQDVEGERFRRLLADARDFLGGNSGMVPSEGFWFCHSRIPQAGGFGSSAALCAAIARLILDDESGNGNREYNRETHFLANHVEKAFHGSPSGIDTGTALAEGVSLWLREDAERRVVEPMLPVRRNVRTPSLYLAYGALPRDKPTAKTVKQIRVLWENGEKTVRDTMAELGTLTENFIEACSLGKSGVRKVGGVPSQTSSNTKAAESFPFHVGGLMCRAQELLASTGLSNRDMDFLIDSALSMGATGGKLSGGGMGGAFVLCCPDSGSRDKLVSSLSHYLQSRNLKLAHPLTPLNLPNNEFENNG